ncbi:helix-turn-helix domain-containing protein [Paraburkholderia sp. XV]|uniref:helix-turn-helix domain-containing protein n=1 Tax=Paraburkholderia sp. XV TaxID=2831520 RepID=UPI001CD70E07|nr:helix-turn-helix transcriptional regulator [Paraburkholderia sp. XV]
MAHPIHDHRYQPVGPELKRLRKERGWLQQDMADRLARTQTFVSKYESGERRLDVIELLDILHVLEADPHTFIDWLLDRATPAAKKTSRR